MSALAAMIVLIANGAAADGLAHDDEVRIFATTMAIARTVKESCAGIAPDDRYLEALRLHLHVDEADRPAFTPVARAAADALQKARDEAPNRQAWCDAVFRLYGPDGRLMRPIMQLVTGTRPQDIAARETAMQGELASALTSPASGRGSGILNSLLQAQAIRSGANSIAGAIPYGALSQTGLLSLLPALEARAQ